MVGCHTAGQFAPVFIDEGIQFVGDGTQEKVSPGKIVDIVDVLEVVDVQVNERMGCRTAFEPFFSQFVESDKIGQAGYLIEVKQVGDSLVGTIARDDDETEDSDRQKKNERKNVKSRYRFFTDQCEQGGIWPLRRVCNDEFLHFGRT